MVDTVTGGCLCGAKRYRVLIDDDDAYLYHCRMCQRAAGSISLALKNVTKSAVAWDRAEPDRYRSSPFAQRGYCAACGTSLTYESDGHNQMDLTVGSFDDPYRFRPVSHSGAESMHEGWLDTRGLPAERTEDNARIVARWKESLGYVPN